MKRECIVCKSEEDLQLEIIKVDPRVTTEILYLPFCPVCLKSYKDGKIQLVAKD